MEHPAPEDVTLTTGAVKKRKKSFEIFHWKFMLLSVLFVCGLCGTTVMWFTTTYNDEIFKLLTLGNGTTLHKAWKNPPLQPLLCVHIFNYTNAAEYFSDENKKYKKMRLKVQDTGPYCFREIISRTNITFLNNGTELSYKEERKHTFDEEASNGSLNDTIVVPNVLIISTYKAIKDMSGLMRMALYTSLNTAGAKILIERSVNEYLFGYEDNIFSVIGNLQSMLYGDEKKLPKRFGVIMKRTGLSNDTIVIRTGDGDLDDMGQVTEINNITVFNAWTTNYCNLVTGSDGLFFRRSLIQTYKDVHLFHKDSCRSLPLNFDSIVDVGSGISAYRYKLRSDVFNYSNVHNYCYCNVSESCNKDGILDISSCPAVQEAPMVISRPHFLDSNANLDSSNKEIIEGFQPDLKKHDFHIDIFPPIGLTVRTLMRMQLNIMVRNPRQDSNLSPLEDKTVLPIVWVEMNSGEVPQKMFSLLYHLTYTMKWVELTLKWLNLIFTLLVAFFLFKISFVKTSSKKEFVLVSKKQSSIVNNVYAPS